MQLSDKLDLEPTRTGLRDAGRARISGLLTPKALRQLTAAISDVSKWLLVTRLAEKHLNLDAAAMRALPADQRAEFDERVAMAARAGFQYLYETYPLYDKAHAGILEGEAPVLARLFAFLNGETFLGAMRDVLDAPEISFADGQLTCYRGGHFLTRHDDGVAGKNRVAAFVLGLSSGWQGDWGGQLQFYDPDGNVEAAYVPRMNTLSLFKVPQPHAVSMVASYVTTPRLAITGWLRSGEDPGIDM
ncbi:2OG-Fe(II) oxygenase [Maricaulis sp.]|uniref:2OG-Fe(II) oxygenase n=1 Tax=Maricaulis sp. TaxID=1486257 RepID=UPI003A959E18